MMDDFKSSDVSNYHPIPDLSELEGEKTKKTPIRSAGGRSHSEAQLKHPVLTRRELALGSKPHSHGGSVRISTRSHKGVPNLEVRGAQLLHSLRDQTPPLCDPW